MVESRENGVVVIHGKSQGFLGLPVRHEMVDDPQMGVCKEMTTAWLPTPDELAALNAGAAVNVHIRTGDVQGLPAPMLVDVGPVPS